MANEKIFKYFRNFLSYVKLLSNPFYLNGPQIYKKKIFGFIKRVYKKCNFATIMGHPKVYRSNLNRNEFMAALAAISAVCFLITCCSCIYLLLFSFSVGFCFCFDAAASFSISCESCDLRRCIRVSFAVPWRCPCRCSN